MHYDTMTEVFRLKLYLGSTIINNATATAKYFPECPKDQCNYIFLKSEFACNPL